MDPDPFSAAASAVGHRTMDTMIKKFSTMNSPDEHSSVSSTNTSLSSKKSSDALLRYWYVASKVAKTQFGVSQLPGPLSLHDDQDVSDAQATAANKVHALYLEGLKDVMTRFYNLGLSRVSTAALLYALDFSLWTRGYALPHGDMDNFNFIQPSAHIGPFSKEYDDFFHNKFAEQFRARQMETLQANAPSDFPFPNAPGGLQYVTTANANIGQPSRHGEDNAQSNPDIAASMRHPKSTAGQKRRTSTKRSIDKTDSAVPAPQPKRPQPDLPLRLLTPLPEDREIRPFPQAKEQSQTVSPVLQNLGQATTNPELVAKICGNKSCGKSGHELADCAGPPNSSGDIDGCPFCNTQEHVLDNCEHLLRTSKDKLFEVLVTRRANRPPIRTAISFLSLAAAHQKLDVLATTIPLSKRVARWSYTENKLWKDHDLSKLPRDPSFSTDPTSFMSELHAKWEALITNTTRVDRNANSIPKGVTLFNRKWVSELVPYNAVYSKIKVQKRGIYPFGPKEDLLRVQQGHRDMVRLRYNELMSEGGQNQTRNSDANDQAGTQEEEE